MGHCALASHLDREVKQFESKKFLCPKSWENVDIFREKVKELRTFSGSKIFKSKMCLDMLETTFLG